MDRLFIYAGRERKVSAKADADRQDEREAEKSGVLPDYDIVREIIFYGKICA